jgi:hypothetical protein
MKKLLAASVASLLLVAGVAAAESDGAGLRISDRLGSSSDTSNQAFGSPTMFVAIAGLAAIAVAAVVLSNHGSNNNNSNSVSP